MPEAAPPTLTDRRDIFCRHAARDATEIEAKATVPIPPPPVKHIPKSVPQCFTPAPGTSHPPPHIRTGHPAFASARFPPRSAISWKCQMFAAATAEAPAARPLA